MPIRLERPLGARGLLETPPAPHHPDWVVVASSADVGVRGVDVSEDEELQRSDVVELVWEDGLITLELPPAEGVYRVPSVRSQESSRGIAEVFLKAWSVLRAVVPSEAGRTQKQVLHALVKAADERISRTTPRMFRIDERGALQPAEIELGERCLVFVHGTFSTVAGAFSSVFRGPDDRWKRLWHRYGGRVFGFEHATLSVSPVRNAIELLGLLPVGQSVDIVSHSRGGMVAELVAGAGGLSEDVPELAELMTVRASRNVHVERHVRVAAPVRGTRLASSRTADILGSLSTMVNLFQVAGLGGPVTAGVSAVLHAARVVARVLTEEVALDPDVTPGLEAMRPGGSVVRALNLREAAVQRLVVGGVYSGNDDLGGRILRLLPNAFFGGDNDLVVDTELMFTTTDRGREQVVATGPGLTHVSYFAHAPTREAIIDWLTNRVRFPDGPRPLDGTPLTAGARSADRGAALDLFMLPSRMPKVETGRVVIVVPGIMGSMLAVDGSRVWVDMLSLVRGSFGRLALANGDGVSVEGVSAGVYEPMVAALERVATAVGVFAFDWRRPILASARTLAGHVRRYVDAGCEVHLVAHSMGSLVCLGMDTDTQKRVKSLVVMGPPFQGSYEALAALRGDTGLVEMLATLDLKNNKAGIVEVTRTFAGLLAMMPRPGLQDADAAPWWRASWWEGASPELGPRLAAAAEEARALHAARWPTRDVTLILGTAQRTRGGLGERWLWDDDDGSLGEGDGTVPYASSNPVDETGKNRYKPVYVPAAHGDIPKHREAIELVTAVVTGSPFVGRDVAFSSGRARDVTRSMLPPAAPLVAWPTDTSLLSAALGGESGPGPGALRHRVRVRVLHGSLEEASHPLLLDYAANGGLRGVLGQLTRAPDDPLRRLAAGRVLPTHPGDLFVYERPAERTAGGEPRSIVFFGISDTFDLTAPLLADAVRAAVRRYLVDAARQARPDGSLSALLVGTDNTGVLSVADSVRGVLEGVNRALEDIVENKLAELTFTELEFVNAYEDLVAAADARIADVVASLRSPHIEWVAELPKRGKRRRGRRLDREDRRVAWHTLTVRADVGSLSYTLTGSTTASLQAELEVPVADVLADLARATARTIHSVGSESWSMSRVLGRQLIPRDLRATIYSGAALRLVLDRGAAALPWELLVEPELDGVPLAVRTPIVRTLHAGGSSPLCAQLSALVYADDASGTGLPSLPGVLSEADEVSSALRDASYAETRVRRTPGGDIRFDLLERLASSSFRILHIAGHGVFDETGSRPSGILTGLEAGVQAVITADQLLSGFGRELPELVFFNCCHLGRLDGRFGDTQPGAGRSRLAASIAEAFISRGVRAVVAAGWAVDDASAAHFARILYRQLLTGVPFGTAVREARRDTWARFPGKNTWGAYQAYGDPTWTLGADLKCAQPTSFRLQSAVFDAIDAALFDSGGGEEKMGRLDDIATAAGNSKLSDRVEVSAALVRAYDALLEQTTDPTLKASLNWRSTMHFKPVATSMAPPEGLDEEGDDAADPGERGMGGELDYADLLSKRSTALQTKKLDKATWRTLRPSRPTRSSSPIQAGPEIFDLFSPEQSAPRRGAPRALDGAEPAPDRAARTFSIGVGRASFVIPNGLATGGYGPASPNGKAGSETMYMRAIVAEDAQGARVALVVGDIHSGTNLIREQVVTRVAALGLSDAQVILAGTHTHTGPGRIYGNSLYDAFAGGPANGSPNPKAYEPVVDATVAAIEQAMRGMKPGATVAPLDGRVSDLARNRSVDAFPPDAKAAWIQAGPGHKAGKTDADRLVDSRIRGLVFRDSAGKVCAVHALVACHNTALGNKPVWDPDFVGRAMGIVESNLPGAIVNIALSGAGDQSPLPASAIAKPGTADKHQGVTIASKRADTLAAAVTAAVHAATPGGAPTIVTRLHWWDPTAPVDPALRLAPWRFGAPTLAGAEDGRSIAATLGFAREGQKRDTLPAGASEEEKLQFPKAKFGAGGLIGSLLMSGARPAPYHPLHQVDVGDVTLLTVPGEPTVYAAWTLERALAEATGKTVLVQGYTGDYAGYFTTASEFEAQHYEGSSTLYGRNTVPHLIALHRGMRYGTRDAGAPPRDRSVPVLAPPPPLQSAEGWSKDGKVFLVVYASTPDAPMMMDGAPPEAVESLAVEGGYLVIGRWTEVATRGDAVGFTLGAAALPTTVRPMDGT